MKKLILLLFCCGFMQVARAQDNTIAEPDFIGEAVALFPDHTAISLEKENIASVIILDGGKVKTKLIIESPRAAVRLSKDNDIRFIVRVADNNSSPMPVINIFRFESVDKQRLVATASVSAFGNVKTGKELKRLPYTAKKYGTGSYLIELVEKPEGEYGITVKNPNNVDEKSVIVATFAIE